MSKLDTDDKRIVFMLVSIFTLITLIIGGSVSLREGTWRGLTAAALFIAIIFGVLFGGYIIVNGLWRAAKYIFPDKK